MLFCYISYVLITTYILYNLKLWNYYMFILVILLSTTILTKHIF